MLIKRLIVISLSILIFQGCKNQQLNEQNYGFSADNLNGNVLFCKPITFQKDNKNFAISLGHYFYLDLVRHIKGQLVNSVNVEKTKDLITWENIITDGILNLDELAYTAKTLNCDTFIVIRLLDASNYSPFRAVLIFEWYDTKSQILLTRLHNDANLSQGNTKSNFEDYLKKQNKSISESLFNDNASLETALLKPEEFQKFVANSTINELISNLNSKNKLKYFLKKI